MSATPTPVPAAAPRDLGRLVRDRRHHYRFQLAPGDALLYDNHRVLHGRTGFRGPRWVRGVYFDPA